MVKGWGYRGGFSYGRGGRVVRGMGGVPVLEQRDTVIVEDHHLPVGMGGDLLLGSGWWGVLPLLVVCISNQLQFIREPNLLGRASPHIFAPSFSPTHPQPLNPSQPLAHVAQIPCHTSNVGTTRHIPTHPHSHRHTHTYTDPHRANRMLIT